MALKVRALTEEVTAELYRLAHSRTAAHRVVPRAQRIGCVRGDHAATTRPPAGL